MQNAVNFPHLGIRLSHVGSSVSVLGFPITYYGMLIGLAMVIGIFIAAAEAKRTKQNPEDYFDLVVFAIIFAVIGARIYYVIFDWSTYKNDLLSIFNIRQGGLAIYGGVIAAVITVFVFAAKKNLLRGKYLIRQCLVLRSADDRKMGKLFQQGGIRRVYEWSFCDDAASGGCGQDSRHYG